MNEDVVSLTLPGRLTPPIICVLLPAALFLANSACCLEISACKSKNELALTPFVLALAVSDMTEIKGHSRVGHKNRDSVSRPGSNLDERF
jgi:hypothetical protein